MPHEISNNVVFVMNSTAVMARGTRVQLTKVGGSEVLPQIGCGQKKNPFLMLTGGLPDTGTKLMFSYSGCTLEPVNHGLAVIE